jgi:hypothetical protein
MFPLRVWMTGSGTLAHQETDAGNGKKTLRVGDTLPSPTKPRSAWNTAGTTLFCSWGGWLAVLLVEGGREPNGSSGPFVG